MPETGPAPQLYHNAKREAAIVFRVWAAALIWVVGYCYLHGYKHTDDSLVVRWGLAEVRKADDFSLILGFPDWVWWGIMVPWLACSAYTIYFGLYVMTDDDLGAEAHDGEETPHGH